MRIYSMVLNSHQLSLNSHYNTEKLCEIQLMEIKFLFKKPKHVGHVKNSLSPLLR